LTALFIFTLGNALFFSDPFFDADDGAGDERTNKLSLTTLFNRSSFSSEPFLKLALRGIIGVAGAMLAPPLALVSGEATATAGFHGVFPLFSVLWL
jgi:hypothetical protein